MPATSFSSLDGSGGDAAYIEALQEGIQRDNRQTCCNDRGHLQGHGRYNLVRIDHLLVGSQDISYNYLKRPLIRLGNVQNCLLKFIPMLDSVVNRNCNQNRLTQRQHDLQEAAEFARSVNSGGIQ